MVQASAIDLTQARDIFPRFNWLNDQDLTQLLSNDIFGSNAHIRAIFNECSLFANKEGHIAGLESQSGEKLHFDAPIEGKLEHVAHLVLCAMQHATRREICTMIAAMKTASSYTQWAESGKINFATVIADSIGFARHTEEAIEEGELKALDVKLNGKLYMLASMARDQSLSPHSRNLVNLLIQRTAYQNHVVDKLIADAVSSVDHDSWKDVLRHYWEDGVKVRVADKEIDYGYEYTGSHELLVMTPLSQECFKYHSVNYCEGRSSVAFGPPGVGKTETIKDLSRLLGRPCRVLPQNTKAALKHTNAWVVYDEIHLWDEADLKVAQGHKSCRGVFVCYNNAHRCEGLQECFHGINMYLPPFELIFEVMLYMEGIHGGLKLGKVLATLMQDCKEKLSKQAVYDFGMRKVKAIVKAAGVLTRFYGDDLSDADSLYNTCLTQMTPCMMKEDKEALTAMLQTLFPESKVHLSEEDSAKLKWFKEHAQDLSAEKCLEVCQTAQSRHGIAIFGDIAKCKAIAEAVVSQQYGVITQIRKAYNMTGEEFLTTLAHAVKNPAENHWILIDGAEKHRESTYKLLDDNKCLMTAEGKVSLRPSARVVFINVSATFEGAAPAFVSRLGLISGETYSLTKDWGRTTNVYSYWCDICMAKTKWDNKGAHAQCQDCKSVGNNKKTNCSRCGELRYCYLDKNDYCIDCCRSGMVGYSSELKKECFACEGKETTWGKLKANDTQEQCLKCKMIELPGTDFCKRCRTENVKIFVYQGDNTCKDCVNARFFHHRQNNGSGGYGPGGDTQFCF